MLSNNKIIRPPFLKRPKLTLGQRASDKLTGFCGSWRFILVLLGFIALWIVLNTTAWFGRWDVWPFIMLNLSLSCLAATLSPIILMSQNRQAEKDRLTSRYDYHVDRKAEHEIIDMQKDLEEIKKLLRRHSSAN